MKQERPEMDDFEEEKKFGCKGKIEKRKYWEKCSRIPIQKLMTWDNYFAAYKNWCKSCIMKIRFQYANFTRFFVYT